MSKVSIIIPSRNERYLTKTVNDIFNKATGEIEVIVVLDGGTKFPLPKVRKNLILHRIEKHKGMRSAINLGTTLATGKYLMKTDAHCMFAKGFDGVLKKDCEDNWVVICRRYNLKPKKWTRRMDTPVDYFYFSCPWTSPNYFMLRVCPWMARGMKRKDTLIDETLLFQGSMWFTTKKHFNNIGKLEPKKYGEFGAEQQEIGFKTWLSGGKVMVNKNTWYAHWHRAHDPRDYSFRFGEIIKAYEYSAHYWTENKWKDRKHDFDWLVDRFWPLPTEENHCNREKYKWEKDWKKYYNKRNG